LNIKNCWLIILAAILVSAIPSFKILAQEETNVAPKVDYSNEVIVDSDLDGLTDKAEIQIYHTDPGNPDTDGDGILDGSEILSGTDPLNSNDPGNSKAQEIVTRLTPITPWVWYTARVAGILGFIFLWLTVFLGLSIRNPIIKKIIEPVYSFDLHCFVAAMAFFWALVHGTVLIFDSKLGFGVKDVFIPFVSQTTLVEPKYLALGIMAFYMMVVMTITSYLRKHLNHKFWRVLHFLNPVAFVFIVVHGYMNGTDMKNFYTGSAFLFSSFVLVLIYFSSLVFAIAAKIKKTTDARNSLNQ
jgi:DMSO/TMAO reductase YedYZ heme-binding membrane subunit